MATSAGSTTSASLSYFAAATYRIAREQAREHEWRGETFGFGGFRDARDLDLIAALERDLASVMNTINALLADLGSTTTAEELLAEPVFEDPNAVYGVLAGGVLRVGGAGMMLYAIGTASGPIGWGGLVAEAYYAHQFRAGAHQLNDLTPTDSLLYQRLTGAGMSSGYATGVEIALDIVPGQLHVRRLEMRGECPSTCSNSIRR